MIRVSDLPRQRRFKFDPESMGRLTHHLFRFPAKFHPPVVRQLIQDYTEEGETILDPFCGSGTLLVEASVLGRNSIGIDVDPLSVFVTNVKVHALRQSSIEETTEGLAEILDELQRTPQELASFKTSDLNPHEYEAELDGAWVPEIPKLHHWFYRYAIVDLARLLEAIDKIDAPQTHRDFLRLIFAATVRGASRADPVPVSGVEVTRVMLEKERKGRSVDVIQIFRKRLRCAVEEMGTYRDARVASANARAYRADIASLRTNLAPQVDVVITSPPYHGAVDYYRRHQLEMFWLGMTKDQTDRLRLLEHYLGRPRVPERHRYVAGESLELAKTQSVEAMMRKVSPERANAFKHYSIGMSRAFQNIARRMDEGACCILVVGHSSWNGGSINTSQLMAELAQPHFKLGERLYYPVKNRYMSYERHNGASIDQEHVLIFERTAMEA
ncbi:MAG: DNA methyltransferase [Solirubrobacterales bacterium]